MRLPMHLFSAAFFGLAIAGPSEAQTYPNRPIRIVVGFVPGAGVDSLARVVGQKLSEMWGQSVIVDNRPGAGGEIAADIVAKAPADGYTLLVSSPGPIAVSPALNPKLSYDPGKQLAPVTMIADTTNALVVHPALPVSSVQELIAMARAKPGGLNFPSSGIGSTPHLTGEVFKHATKIDLVHVPYKGGGAAIIDLVAGRMDLMFSAIAPVFQQIKAKRLKPLGVTSLTRSKVLPDVPTIHESGVPNFEAFTWYGLFVPTGVPKSVVDKLAADVAKGLRLPETTEMLAASGMEVSGNSPAEFSSFTRRETVKWAGVIRAAGIKSQ